MATGASTRNTGTDFESGPAHSATAWLNWCLAVAFVILVFTSQTGYAITNTGVQTDLKLSVAQIGLIGLIYTWAFALTQLLSGPILDRLGIRWVLPSAAMVVSAGGLVFADAGSLEMLVAGQILMALGGSFGFIGAGYTGGAWFGPLKYGVMFGWVQFVSCLAAIAGQRTLGQLVETIAWRDLMAAMAWAGLLLSIIMFAFMRNPQSHKKTSERGLSIGDFLSSVSVALGNVLSIRDSWINALIGAATFGTMLALGVVWGPKLLVSAGMGQADAFASSATMWAGLAFGAPTFLWFSNFVRSHKWPMLIGCAAQLLTIEIIMFVPDFSPTMASICFFVWGFMAAGSMLNFAAGAEIAGPGLTGTSAAVVNGMQFVTGGLIMAIPGWLLTSSKSQSIASGLGSSLGDHQLALMIFPLTLLIALFLFPFLRDTHPQA